MLKVAINGFGRIGRAAFKIALASKNIQVVAINDLADIKNLAYLLRYDSVYGRYDKKVQVKGKKLVVNGKKIPVYSIPEPRKLPWRKKKVDVVLECTGFFTKKEEAKGHLKAGAQNVIISAPTKSGGVVTVVKGVNHEVAKGQQIIANASCTTNCVAPVMAVLEASFGVEKSLLTTIHATTATQRVVDGPHKDWRKGRTANNNIIPSTTGAAVATTLTLPELKNKFDGIAVRVPVACGSLVDVVAVLKKNVKVKDVNNAFLKASRTPLLKHVLDVSEEELVSSDIIGTTASAIVDLKFTRVVGGNLVKVLAWYDNEWAYANRLVEMISHV